MIKKNKNRNKYSLLILVLVSIFALFTYMFYFRDSSNVKESTPTTPDTINFTPATEEEVKEAEDNKLDDSETVQNVVPPTQNEAKITEAYYDQSISQVVIKTELLGLGWDGCTVKLTKGQYSLTKEAKTLYQQDYSTCLGFSIERSAFNSTGQWEIELSAKKMDGSILIGTSSVTIK